MTNYQIAVVVICAILGFILGYFLGRVKFKPKIQGELRFVIQDDGDGNDFINCIVKPDSDWDKVMRQTDICFKVTKDPRIDRAFNNPQ